MSGADGAARPLLIATGSEVSLAVDAAKMLEARGTATRVVSMPCWDFFEAQPSISRHVLPPGVAARVSIEAGATFGWERWVGEHGITFGIDRFGASAPAADIAKAFGFTPEHVAKVASRRSQDSLGEREHPIARLPTPARAFGSTTFGAACSRRENCGADHNGLRGMTQSDDLRAGDRQRNDYDEQFARSSAPIRPERFWDARDRGHPQACDAFRLYDASGGRRLCQPRSFAAVGARHARTIATAKRLWARSIVRTR